MTDRKNQERLAIVRLEFDKIRELVAQRCVCDAAKDMARAELPSTDLAEAAERLALTDALFGMLVKNSSPQIGSCGEIPEIVLRAEKGGALSIAELLRVRSMLRNARSLNAWYSDELDPTGAASRAFYGLYENAGFERALTDAILSETELADDASPALREIRRKITRAESSVRDKLDAVVKGSSKYLQDSLVTMRGGRFVVPVKIEHKNEVKGLVHDVSSSGSTLFIEPAAVVEANNQIMQLRGEERAEIERILSAFSSEVANMGESLLQSYRAFINVDLALGKAKYGATYDGIAAELNCDGIIDLHRARHPLIPKSTVVPIDIRLGRDYKQLIITGPNTGGKTVSLKTTGLLTLMACSGMLIPAAEGSEVCVFDRVLADIGDEQSIEQSLSTFSAHISNIVEILKIADDRTLVLVDELGSGTDPAEGAALAAAILNRLRSLGSLVLATTHYGEIKLYALETEGVQNASCEFDVKSLRPTYRLNIGIPGRSNALLIGERLGLDAELLDEARQGMKVQDRRFEDMMSEMEALKSGLSDREREIEREKAEADEIVARAKAEYEKLVKQGNKELDAARNKAKQLSADVSAGAYRLLDEIKKLDASKDKDRAAAKARAKQIANRDAQKLADIEGVDADVLLATLEPVESPKVGDSVYIAALGQVGTITALQDGKGAFEVQAGTLKTRVRPEGLRRAPSSAAPKKSVTHYGVRSESVNEKRSGRNEINLLGLNVEEALDLTDRFIDGAVLSHLETVYIIHGKGTGTLRSAIHKHLKTMKQVKSFRLGTYGEGETGVTVVELK